MGIMGSIRWSIVSLASWASTSAAVTSTGSTVEVNGIPYFVPPQAVATISVVDYSHLFTSSLFSPLAVVHDAPTNLTSLVSSYLENDDVFQEAFLQALYLPNANATWPLALNATVLSSPHSLSLPSGPYFLSATGSIHQAWRLYPDTAGAFTESIMPSTSAPLTFSVLPAGLPGQQRAIAVPSRLYYTRTAAQPLAGVRVGIKDIYDIAGMRTGNGNRAWYALYPPANVTAPVVQRLIDAGAVLVGKMLTSQFANGEVATADWVSYHEAFNPRGDGYQDTSSSSSGGGAGIAAYSWLDAALGSDTGGSVRNPAQVQGVYGIRPSRGLVSLEHVMPLSPALDTPGVFVRDPVLLGDVARVLYQGNISSSAAYPRRIKTLDWPDSAATTADALLIDFLADLTAFLNATAAPYDISTAWTADHPSAPSLDEMLNLTYPVLISQQQSRLVRDPFYADYAGAHDGRRPFVDPVPLVRWGWGDNTTETLDRALANKTAYMSWFNSRVLAPNAETCSDSLLVYVGTAGDAPQYRNIYLDEPQIPAGFGRNGMTGFAEVPDYVVPIGETAYFSTVTMHEEVLPVAVDLVAAKGCDGMLVDLIADLHGAGILRRVEAGRSGVSGGEVLLKRWGM